MTGLMVKKLPFSLLYIAPAAIRHFLPGLREGFKKKILKKSDNYPFRGGGQRGSFITFFFGLKMIFKQF